MQWSKKGAHRLLQTRTRTLDNTLHDVFTSWYPAMPANDGQPAPFAAAALAASHGFWCSRMLSRIDQEEACFLSDLISPGNHDIRAPNQLPIQTGGLIALA